MLDQQKITILYCRLSNEDAQEGESNSIANQREYLTRYARDHGYTNLKILVDDGYTGTNFNRPGVQEGFELVKQGLVGCWLVKDLSRFGRDYLTVGQYTDIIFPSYDVRFIAINDGVDSNRGDSEGFAAIRNLFNEWYPRDTSKKVRVSLRQRGTSGKHMGKPPYGYRCDPEDKDHWILDEEAAPVVKLIFDLCIDGKGPEQIARILEEKQILDKLWETYQLSHEAARAQRQTLESIPKAQRRIGELKRAISGLGNINLDAIEEFQRVNERYTYLTGQRDDVQKSKTELERVIADITGEMKAIFAQQFSIINQAFGETFLELFGGGKATLELEDETDILNCGIEIRVQPPGKALKVLSLLSGGEKAFVAIALYFAILKVRPTPFCVMDEIEAALDDANVTRFARYLRQMADRTQFIVITHRRGTMEEADVLYGVTMQEQGISRLLTINLNDVEAELKIK